MSSAAGAQDDADSDRHNKNAASGSFWNIWDRDVGIVRYPFKQCDDIVAICGYLFFLGVYAII